MLTLDSTLASHCHILHVTRHLFMTAGEQRRDGHPPRMVIPEFSGGGARDVLLRSSQIRHALVWRSNYNLSNSSTEGVLPRISHAPLRLVLSRVQQSTPRVRIRCKGCSGVKLHFPCFGERLRRGVACIT